MTVKKPSASKKTTKKKTKKKTLPKVSKSEIKSQLFIEEYLVNFFNATHAYKKIYNPEVSDNSAAVEGSKLLRKPKVKEYLAMRIEERRQEAVMDAKAVAERYKKIVKADFVQVFAEMTKGELLDLPSEIREMMSDPKLIKRNKTNRDGSYEEEELYSVKFMSKDNALNALAKYTGAFEKDNNKTLDVNVKGFSQALKELDIDDDE